MSKLQKKATVTPENMTVRKNENSWILLAKDTLLENKNFAIISLPHPGTGNVTKYCLDKCHKKMYEVVTYNEPHRSWFIGETVKSDGSIHILSPINPLFIILSRLRKECIHKAVPLEDLLSEKGYDQIIGFITDLDKVADLKGAADIKAYKYNEEKTLIWLENRVREVAKVLRHKNIHVTTGSTSSTFVSSNIDNDGIDEEFYIKYAHELVSEYLEDDLIENLEKRFNFQTNMIETLTKKRKLDDDDGNSPNKKIKSLNNNDNVESVVCTPKIDWVEPRKTPVTAKEKARQKAASGTKTISSFFQKTVKNK